MHKHKDRKARWLSVCKIYADGTYLVEGHIVLDFPTFERYVPYVRRAYLWRGSQKPKKQAQYVGKIRIGPVLELFPVPRTGL